MNTLATKNLLRIGLHAALGLGVYLVFLYMIFNANMVREAMAAGLEPQSDSVEISIRLFNAGALYTLIMLFLFAIASGFLIAAGKAALKRERTASDQKE